VGKFATQFLGQVWGNSGKEPLQK